MTSFLVLFAAFDFWASTQDGQKLKRYKRRRFVERTISCLREFRRLVTRFAVHSSLFEALQYSLLQSVPSKGHETGATYSRRTKAVAPRISKRERSRRLDLDSVLNSRRPRAPLSKNNAWQFTSHDYRSRTPRRELPCAFAVWVSQEPPLQQSQVSLTSIGRSPTTRIGRGTLTAFGS